MTVKDYQEYCKKAWKPGCDELVFALGLGGETGEVLEIVKKARRDCKEIDIPHLREELGDVLWYVANMCTSHGFDMEEIMEENVTKLNARYELN